MKTKLITSTTVFFCLSIILIDTSLAQTSNSESSNKVLLITSAQVDLLSEDGKAWGFTKGSEEKNHLRENLKKVIAKARELNIPIIHSPVGFDYNLMAGHEPLNPFQKIIIDNKLLEINAPGSKFIPEALPSKNDIVLPYRQGFSSFWAKSIQEHLKNLGVKTIYIAGMLAEGCIESHTRDAAENGYSTIVITDAIGSTSLDLLEATEKSLALHAKAMIDTEEFLKTK